MTLRRIFCWAAVLTFAASFSARAQTATLVRDINQEGSGKAEFGNFGDITPVPGRVFFSATDGMADNREMWASDGTAEGTFLLKDICPGPCDSETQVLGRLGGILLWAAEADDGTLRLWRSDGTRAGTFRLLDTPIRFNGDPFSSPQQISSVAGGFLYVSDGGGALWRTDGTRAGTRLVRALDGVIETLLTAAGKVFLLVRQGSPGGNPGDPVWSVWTSDGTEQGTRAVRSLDRVRPRQPRVAGGHLFFLGRDSTAGYELWASDGTETGTRTVTDFAAPSPFGPEQDISSYGTTISGDRLFFVADDVAHGQEIWMSDGTPAGTRRITDFGTAEPRFGHLTDLGGLVLFTADDQLGHEGVWTTAGDPAGTRFLPLPCGAECQDRIRLFVKVGPRVVIFATANFGNKILSTDGTPAGTRLLRDCPQDCAPAVPRGLAEAGQVYFATNFGQTLWRTDGTPAGTQRQPLLRDGSVDSDRYTVTAVGPLTLVFGLYRDSTALWALDPGSTEARLVKVSAPDSLGLYTENFTSFQDGVAFTACDGETFALWRSVGTEQSTLPAVHFPRQSGISGCSSTVPADAMASLGSSLVFLRYEEFTFDTALWGTDGTGGGTQRLTPEGLVALAPLVAGNGRAFFRARRDETVSLWTTDGTPGGTRELVSWDEGSPSFLTVLGGELYFFRDDNGRELWKSDGTPQGTRKVADGNSSTLPPAFTRLGSAVYFDWRVDFSNDGIWRTDGSAAGTLELGTVAGMDRNPYPSDLIAFQGSLYYFAWVADEVRGLWRSDGTAAGTVLLAQFPETGNSAYPHPHDLTAAGGRLFFVADDGKTNGGHGMELWVTDGTAAGTHLVRDIRPGGGPSRPDQLVAAGDRLYFTAAEETYGRELWMSDGTEAGTRLVQDISPFASSSEPQRLTVGGNRLYFTADDGITGRELWSLPLAGPAGCQPSPTRLCLNGGRYQVEATWRIGALYLGTLREGRGTAVPLTADTGYFWFFSPTNVEAIVKILDGQGQNGHVWVFYGALSDVQYTITVTDTQTGLTRRYANPQGQLASVGDTHGFGPLGAFATYPLPPVATAPPSPLPLISERTGKAATVPCQASAQRLCLNNNRFAVEVAWKDFQNHEGKGTAVPLTGGSGETGTFWFFDAANIELVVKALDGRQINGKFWLFYGALSNVEYTLTVTDTQTGTVRTYKNPRDRFASVGDTNAF